MNSRREKWIAIAAGIVVGVFLLDWMFLSPLLESRDALVAKRVTLQAQVDQNLKLLATSRRESRDFRKRHAAGLASDASATESRLLNDLRNWSQEAGLTLSSVRPDRPATGGGLREIAFDASGVGSMRALAGLLYRLQMTDSALRMHELQISSRNEATG